MLLKAAIFDMDGVLINSEPLWRIAEKEIFSSIGVPVTEEMIYQTSALTIKEVCEYWYKIYPWKGKSFEEIENSIVDRVIELISTNETSMPGIKNIMKILKKKTFKIGMATNSSHKLIEAVLNKIKLKNYFDFIASAEDVENGKPSPEIYLHVAKNLNVHPEQCIVFEDSIIGIRSALDAGMIVVAVPASEDFNKPEFDIAHFKIHSLNDFSHFLNLLNIKQV